MSITKKATIFTLGLCTLLTASGCSTHNITSEQTIDQQFTYQTDGGTFQATIACDPAEDYWVETDWMGMSNPVDHEQDGSFSTTAKLYDHVKQSHLYAYVKLPGEYGHECAFTIHEGGQTGVSETITVPEGKELLVVDVEVSHG